MTTGQNTTAPFDAFKILDHELKEMPVTHDIPRGYGQYILPGSRIYSTTGRSGTFLFQEIVYPEYSFWISNYFTKVRKKVLGSLSEPSLEVQFILKGDILYRLESFDWQKLEESQYNLLFIPSIENEVYFDHKDYLTFDIHPSIKLLKQMASNLPELKGFIQKINKGWSAQFFESHQFASPGMLYLIKNILEQLKRKSVRNRNSVLDDLVQQLIELALLNTNGNSKPCVNFYDVEKLYFAEAMMVKHMDDSKILEKQISASHIYKAKFRDGFRQIFNALPHTYLRHKRMEKAKYLLEHRPRLKIMDIAERVGYLNPNYFSTIYKKNYGLSPRKFRNNLRL